MSAFTPTGVIVGSLTLGVLLLATVQFNKEGIRRNIILSVGLLFPVAIGLVMRFYFGNTHSTVNTTNYEMLKFVFGNGYRGVFALFCLAISPFFITNRGVKRGYGRFVLLCVVLLVFPLTSKIIAGLTYVTASWRWLWMLPVPLAMCIVMGSVSRLYKNKTSIPVGYILFIFLSTVFILSPKPLVISEENYTRFIWPDFKLHDHEKIWLRHYGKFGLIRNNYIYLEGSDKEF